MLARKFEDGANAMLSALIIDDEPLAHEVLEHHLAQHQDITIAGHCYSAVEALQWLAKHPVDVVFLDIRMPQLSGIEMLKVMGKRPQVIIVSAYQDYALEGFDLAVCDYLLKPVSEQRFAQALDKLQQQFQTTTKHSIVLRVDRELQKFELDNVDYFEAYGNYVKVWQQQHCMLVNSTLKNITDQLPKKQFTQIHKSYVINNAQVQRVSSDKLRLTSGAEVKVGRTYKQVVAGIL